MSSSLKAGHVSRYLALARLLLKHRGASLAGTSPESSSTWRASPRMRGRDTATDDDARHLVDELFRMGPTFIKLGQLLSTRADLLPPVYLDALARLRDDVEPLEPGIAEQVVEERARRPASTAFGSFDARPSGRRPSARSTGPRCATAARSR